MVDILFGVEVIMMWFWMKLHIGINIKCFNEWSVAIEFVLQLGTMIFSSVYSVTYLSDRKPMVSSYFLSQIEN